MIKIFRQYYPIRNILFIIGEGLAVFISVLLASLLILGVDAFSKNPWIYLKALLITFFCQACLYYNDLYDLKVTSNYTELAIRLFQALGAASIILAFIYWIFSQAVIGEGIFVVSVGFAIVFIVLWRFCYTLILNIGVFDERVILLGSGELADKILYEIRDKKDCGYIVSVRVAEPSADIDEHDTKHFGIICKKSCDGLLAMAKKMKIKKIVVAIKQQRGAFPMRALLDCRVAGITIMRGNDFYELLTGKLLVDQINPAWLIFSEGFKKSRIRAYLKRTVDIILSFILLLLFMPIMILAGILIKIDSDGPVLFSQDRVGQRKKTFTVYKFRSMVKDAEKLSGPVWATEKDPRITRMGAVIRKLRIDEIPQIWNVFKGDMSFVGPRPEREYFVEQLETQIPYYSERFTVKPGITGWAQVNYGYGASVQDAIEKLNYDLFYTKNFSIFMDFMIVLRTVKIVIFGRGR